MITLGVTGGIGSGKTTVCKFLETLGIPVYYADDRAKWLMQHDDDCIAQIKKAFGEEAYRSDGKLNRTYLAANVFNQEEKLQVINAIVHPAVATDFEHWRAQHRNQKIIAKEAALLVETGSYKNLDKLLLVEAPMEIRIQRVLARDPHRTEEDVKHIIAKQMPDEDKRQYADFIVHNDDENELISSILSLVKTLTEEV